MPSTIDAPEMTVAATAVPLRSTNRQIVETTFAYVKRVRRRLSIVQFLPRVIARRYGSAVIRQRPMVEGAGQATQRPLWGARLAAIVR